ncbi:MAG TPA: FtsQ-type POTRA domain-containing protein [Micromonosporaceae bacterium]
MPGGVGRGGPRGGARRWRLVRARTDALPSSVRRFMRRARRRRVRAALPWTVAGAALALAGVGAWVVYGTSFLGVREVRVTGIAILSRVEVERAAAVPQGTPLTRVNLGAVRTRVAALAPVGSVEVRRDWPDAIVVAIVERTPAIAVPRDNRFLLVDGHGVAYQIVARRPAGVPLARLAAPPGPAEPTTRAALLVLRALTVELRGQLVAIVVDGPARIRLELRDDRQIVWGDATENEAKAQVATALLARDGDTIDVSAPDVVTIR